MGKKNQHEIIISMHWNNSKTFDKNSIMKLKRTSNTQYFFLCMTLKNN